MLAVKLFLGVNKNNILNMLKKYLHGQNAINEEVNKIDHSNGNERNQWNEFKKISKIL